MGRIPRFSTTPIISTAVKPYEDVQIASQLVPHVPRMQTAPAEGSLSFDELSDIFARRAQADRARGAYSAAENEDKRAETLQRVKTSLAEITGEDGIAATCRQESVLPHLVLTTFKGVTTRGKASDNSSIDTKVRLGLFLNGRRGAHK